jgi:hypothetical protein
MRLNICDKITKQVHWEMRPKGVIVKGVSVEESLKKCKFA